jgi:phytanoyl-CoA hydroxylase
MFKVYSNQIPKELIEQFLDSHVNFKKDPLSFFRAQGTTRFEKPMLDSFGNQINSIHNPHLLGFNNKFSSLINQIVTHVNVSRCLTEFTGSSKHVWYQSMFFDKSTGTKLHQDSWYLDTIPNGKLVGVWIALEDIDYSSGPFCIYTNTDQNKISPDEFDFDDIENDRNFTDSYPNSKRFDFTARKGDILVWDSFSIHGALLPKDESMTRKSITSHFYPIGITVQEPPTRRFFSIYDHSKPKETNNPNILLATTINTYLYQFICLIFFMLEKFQILKSLIMRERKDKGAHIRRI